MNLFSVAPMLVFLSIAISVVACRKRPFAIRLLAILAAYLFWVAFAATLGFSGMDEFGFRFVPLITITAPWYFLPGLSSPPNLLPSIILGACIFASVLSLLARLIGYSKDSSLPFRRAAEDTKRP